MYRTDRKRKVFYDKVSGIVFGATLTIVTLVYVMIGILVSAPLGANDISAWTVFAPLFILTVFPSGLVRSIAFRRPDEFPIYSPILFCFLFLGLYLGVWHPTWVILMVIPVYYILVESFRNFQKAKEEYKESKDDDNIIK